MRSETKKTAGERPVTGSRSRTIASEPVLLPKGLVTWSATV